MGLRTAWSALFERKQSRARSLIAIQRVGQAAFTERRYDRLAEEAFRKNVVAKRAIEQISRKAAGVPWLLYQKGRKKRTEIEEHEILDLLDRPNPLQGRAGFFEAAIGFYMIAGNSYIEAVGPTSGSNVGKPLELWPLRPDRTGVIKGPGGMPAGWKYTVDGQSVEFLVDRGRSPILHLKTFHPLDDWYGMSPIEAVAFSVDQHNEASKWNMALLQNSAAPSGAFVATATDQRPSGELTDTQYERLEEQIEERYTSGVNAGRPLLLEGGLDWKQISFSPKDMDWLQGKQGSARDVALGLGYPPLLLGLPGDNTFANYKEANIALWEDTILPLLNFLRDELNNWLVPFWGEDLKLDYDRDQIDAINEKRFVAWDRMNATQFLSTNEKRAALGYEEITGGDTVLVPSGMMPLDLVVGEDILEE